MLFSFLQKCVEMEPSDSIAKIFRKCPINIQPDSLWLHGLHLLLNPEKRIKDYPQIQDQSVILLKMNRLGEMTNKMLISNFN